MSIYGPPEHAPPFRPGSSEPRVKIALVPRLPIAHESMAGFGICMAIGEEERRNKMLIETRLHTYVLNGTEPTVLEEAADAWDFLKDDC
jgi:hypothetical protein